MPRFESVHIDRDLPDRVAADEQHRDLARSQLGKLLWLKAEAVPRVPCVVFNSLIGEGLLEMHRAPGRIVKIRVGPVGIISDGKTPWAADLHRRVDRWRGLWRNRGRLPNEWQNQGAKERRPA